MRVGIFLSQRFYVTDMSILRPLLLFFEFSIRLWKSST